MIILEVANKFKSEFDLPLGNDSVSGVSMGSATLWLSSTCMSSIWLSAAWMTMTGPGCGSLGSENYVCFTEEMKTVHFLIDVMPKEYMK